MTHTSFHPIEKTLMGPGPSNVHPRVLQALGRPVLGHLDPDFTDLMDDIKTLLRQTFQTKNDLTFPVSAPGSAGMEMCFVNLVEPGDKVIVCINGVFGSRMRENVERCGGTAIIVHDDWGMPVRPAKVEAALKQHPDAKILAFVQAETSTGVNSDTETLCALAKAHGCLTIVDAVTALAGSPLYVDQWGIDAIYSGTQKCLSCPPGLSPVSFSDRAVETIQNRKTKPVSWFLDLSLVMNYWREGKTRTYHHTAPVNAMYGLHESLVLLDEEGLASAWARHQTMHEQLRTGLENLGFDYLVETSARLPQLNAVRLPPHLIEHEATLRTRLLRDYKLEIGAGLGDLSGKIWRIGLMGYGASDKNVSTCLSALSEVLSEYH